MTHYETLGVSPTASANELRKAHRRLAKKYHPDKLRYAPPATIKQAEEKFKEIQEAYDILTKRRAEYDGQLWAEAASAAQPTAARAQTGTGTTYAPFPDPPSAPNFPARQKWRAWYRRDSVFQSTGAMVLLGWGILFAYRVIFSKYAPGYSGWSERQLARSFTENFEGTIRNQSANVSAAFRIALLESSGDVAGCMAIEQPLYGSGPLEGRYKADGFMYTVTSPLGKATFTGKRFNGSLEGSYVFVPKEGAGESGTFTLGKVDSGSEDDGLKYENCPTDAEVHQK